METDPMDAQSALDAVAAAERRSAQIATSTPWYAPWYGITCAGFPVAFALIAAHLVAVEIALVLVLLASLAALVSTYQRVTGVWPSIRGTSRHLLIAVIVVMVGAALVRKHGAR
jgi:hypothetical protein